MNTDRQPAAKIRLRDALRRLRERLDVTQERMAQYMGVTVRSIARWETEADSLEFDFLIRLRHLAIEAEEEDLAEYFHRMIGEAWLNDEYADESLATYDFLPANLEEMRYVGELLRRLRSLDSAIEPAIRNLDELIQEREAREEEQRKADEQAARQSPRPKLRDKLRARAKGKEEKHEEKRTKKKG